jgi:hypothetical protein
MVLVMQLLLRGLGLTYGVTGRLVMLDVLYIGLALGFLALSWGLVALCDRL